MGLAEGILTRMHESSFVQARRSARMHAFIELMRLPPGARVIDLGGTPGNWGLIPHHLRITLVNLPGDQVFRTSLPSGMKAVAGDATSLGHLFGDGSFDVVFSNSLLEHLGDLPRQAAFASEVIRLAPAYWIQTPGTWFPIEPHTGTPYFWHIPSPLRQRMVAHWQRTNPVFGDDVAATRGISRRRLQLLFPNAEIWTERVLGMPKSIVAYRPAGVESG